MLVPPFTSREGLGQVNSLHFTSVLVDAVDAQPHTPAGTGVPSFTHKVPMSVIPSA